MAKNIISTSNKRNGRNAARSAFSLFEVAISLAIVALSVTSVLLLFPMGVKTQQQARFRLYAAAKAQEMVESFAASHNTNPNIDAEAMQAWDVPVGYRATHPDLEARLSTHLFGIMPLPMAIARRLDSDNDEIQKILDEGGYLYYSQPQATTNLDPTAYRTAPPNEAQKLVFAVAGYAQNNALFSFPWKAWPYYAPYPSPPVGGIHMNEYLPATAQTFNFPTEANGNGPFGYCWESASDPGDPYMRVVFDHTEGAGPSLETYGYRPYAYQARNQFDTADANRQVRQQREAVIHYVQAALWYAKQVGVPASVYDPTSTTPLTDFFALSAPFAGRVDKQVLALRFLAHASMCLTRWYPLDRLGGQPSTTSPTPTTSVLCDEVMLMSALSPKVWITHDKIVFWHESSLNLAMLYAASYPYDWGAPRPLQRATMMDYPLIEWDLSDPAYLLPGNIFGTSIPAAQWRPLSASPVINANGSYQFPEFDYSPVWSANADRQQVPDGGIVGRSRRRVVVRVAHGSQRDVRPAALHVPQSREAAGVQPGRQRAADRQQRRRVPPDQRGRHSGVKGPGRQKRAPVQRRLRRRPQLQSDARSRPAADHRAHARDVGRPLQLLRPARAAGHPLTCASSRAPRCR